VVDHRRTTNKCPICKKSTEEAFRPFCSKRYADADLLKWIKGEYAIPATDSLPLEEFDPFDESGQTGTAH